MRNLLVAMVIVIGGPFLDDSGGMMVSRAASLEAAQKLANDDPAVVGALLNVNVKPWMVPMSTVPVQ